MFIYLSSSLIDEDDLMKFIDRDKEISSLNDSYSSKGSKLIVIYGRRRIGKTELIKKFGENLKGKFVYYFCDTLPITEQSMRIAASVGGCRKRRGAH